MTWTTTPPTEEGWYWWMAAPNAPKQVRRVNESI